jgi:hypothetical protein
MWECEIQVVILLIHAFMQELIAADGGSLDSTITTNNTLMQYQGEQQQPQQYSITNTLP